MADGIQPKELQVPKVMRQAGPSSSVPKSENQSKRRKHFQDNISAISQELEALEGANKPVSGVTFCLEEHTMSCVAVIAVEAPESGKQVEKYQLTLTFDKNGRRSVSWNHLEKSQKKAKKKEVDPTGIDGVSWEKSDAMTKALADVEKHYNKRPKK